MKHYKEIDAFFKIHQSVRDVISKIMFKVNLRSFELGDILPGQDGDYIFVEVNYKLYGEDMTWYIDVPCPIILGKEDPKIFIRKEIDRLKKFGYEEV